MKYWENLFLEKLKSKKSKIIDNKYNYSNDKFNDNKDNKNYSIRIKTPNNEIINIEYSFFDTILSIKKK